MNTVARFFNNYNIDRNDSNINTNANITQVECERNVCQQELYRLKYGLENLLNNKSYNSNKLQITNWIDECWSCCRRCTKNRNYNKSYINKYRNANHSIVRSSFDDDSIVLKSSLRHIGRKKYDLQQNISNLQTKKATPTDLSCKSVLFKILQAKILDCLSRGQQFAENKSNSIGISPLSSSYDSSSVSSMFTDKESLSSYFGLSQRSNIDTISSLKSSSIAAFPHEKLSSNGDYILSQSSPKKDILKVDDYEKSTLTVPPTKRSSKVFLSDVLFDS
ncbi:unnamed protein product [Rotaria magnacalcarata]|uniref:Uncharacterized protein n=2 Tax=Rotaria magnacalcarata TaxID=392030 RepID=A0A818XNK4_9BILA|nr:unnamed protein product [Rotaria magnacalcarata]